MHVTRETCTQISSIEKLLKDLLKCEYLIWLDTAKKIQIGKGQLNNLFMMNFKYYKTE